MADPNDTLRPARTHPCTKFTDTPLFQRMVAAEIALGESVGIEASVDRGARFTLLAAHVESGWAFDPDLHLAWMKATTACFHYINNVS